MADRNAASGRIANIQISQKYFPYGRPQCCLWPQKAFLNLPKATFAVNLSCAPSEGVAFSRHFPTPSEGVWDAHPRYGYLESHSEGVRGSPSRYGYPENRFRRKLSLHSFRRSAAFPRNPYSFLRSKERAPSPRTSERPFRDRYSVRLIPQRHRFPRFGAVAVSLISSA